MHCQRDLAPFLQHRNRVPLLHVGASHFATRGTIMATNVVTVDGRGRIAVPSTLREQLDLKPGDALFVQVEENGSVLRLAKAINPFESFAALGEREYRAGRTKNLRTFAAEEGIALDDDDPLSD
jgi:AbrB family looped-hinge helix DNA binding protein